MILIVGSNHDDVIYFQSALKDAKEEIILNKYRAYVGTILNQNVMVLQDVYTSYVSSALLTHIIEKYFVLMVFVVGTCFAQNKALKVGDIAISEMATFGDVDQIRMIKGTELGQIPGYPQLFYANKELIKNMEESLNSVGATNFTLCTFMNSSIGIVRIGVADAVTVITAQTDAQTGDRVIIDTQGCCIFVGYIELHGRLMTLVNPTYICKLVGIQGA